MSSEPSAEILRLAQMVTDGAAVDWDSERLKTPELAGEIAELEMLARIRIAHDTAAGKDSNAMPGAASLPAGAAARAPLFRWGKLEVLELLGEGTFGEVYRAFDPALQTEVALKLRKPTAGAGDLGEELFLSEARRLARVRHPNVLTVFGVETHDGRAGIWTEFVRGKTLETCLEEQGTWHAREAALVGIDLCRALAAVHAAGLIHRDVKTTNVMRERGGRIVLMDFGSGGELPREGGVLTTRHIHGTPVAMAPEQLRGQVVGPATDVYGLGVLLYRLVTGAFPVEAGTTGELADRHARGERKSLRGRRPDLPTEFVQVVERALEPRSENRFPGPGEMELTLAGTLHAQVHGRRWRPLASLLLAAGLVIAIAWNVGHRTRPTTLLPKGAPAPAAQSSAVLTATASLYRHTDTGEERLLPGAQVAPGDHLFLSLQGSDSMFVYILSEDELGQINVLFPIRGMSPVNPLAPAVTHRIPEQWGNEQADWNVTSAGGKETITALASREPLADVEREIDKFPKAQPGHPIEYPKISQGAFRSLRGIGGIEPEPSAGRPQRHLSDALKALAQRKRGADGPWIWQAELENPAPR